MALVYGRGPYGRGPYGGPRVHELALAVGQVAVGTAGVTAFAWKVAALMPGRVQVLGHATGQGLVFTAEALERVRVTAYLRAEYLWNQQNPSNAAWAPEDTPSTNWTLAPAEGGDWAKQVPPR